MPPSRNPFRPAEQVAPKVKALVFGASGVGKTYLSLTAPGKVAVIDTEGGTAFYARRAGRGGLSQFDVLPTKTYRDVQDAVQYLASHPTEYGSLVIDPVTVVYETLQDAAQIKRADKRHDPDADLEMLDWQRIKRSYKSLMTELVNLPIHVIVTAREKDETERRGNESVKIGVKPDAEKGTSYFFDTVLRLYVAGNRRIGEVLKDRTGSHELGAQIEAPTFDLLFGSAIKAGRKDTAARNVQSDEAAAQTDADTTFSWSRETVKAAIRAAGVETAAAAASLERVAEGRPVTDLDAADWREVAIDLGLATADNATTETAEAAAVA